MTKTLESADRFLKFGLSLGVILCYLFEVIAGPFAIVLVVLASMVLLSFLISVLIARGGSD